MKTLLRLEELAQFLVCLLALIMNDVPWWTYLLLVLGPDIGMLGYLVNARVGAVSYNTFHHKGIASGFWILGVTYGDSSPSVGMPLILIGFILYGHSSMDRALGYGLKYSDDFKHTHLGWIGKKSEQ